MDCTPIPRRRAYALVMLGASLWGCVGIFVNGLAAQGLSPMQIAWLRMLGGAGVIAVWMARVNPRRFRLRPWQDVRYFVLTGAVSIAVFQWSYISAIRTIGISTSVVLLYTSPGFVVLFSRVFFAEPISRSKLVCLASMFAGVVAVTGALGTSAAGTTARDAVSPAGIALGLLAGLSFSLYSVVGKRALGRYGTQTVTVYTFAIAAVALTAPALQHAPVAWLSPSVIGWSIGIIAVPTIAAYLFYTAGLRHVESGRAAIAGTSEVVVATIVGTLLFGEPFGALQLVGSILIIVAAVGIQRAR